jgi:DNA-directed RNA polymerase alpha subunit
MKLTNWIILNRKIDEIGIDFLISEKLINKGVNTVKDLWSLKKSDLKKYALDNTEINQIVIKMQLIGLDLNRKTYNE